MSEEDPFVNGTPLSTLRVVDLKEELDKHGLSKLGNKSALADRLRAFLLNGTRDSVSPTKSPQKDASVSPVKSPPAENPIVAAYRAKQQAALQEAQKEKDAERARTASESGESANVSIDENSRKEVKQEEVESNAEEKENDVSNNDQETDERLRDSATSSPASEAAAKSQIDEASSQNGSNAVNLPSVMHWGNDNVETTERTREDSKEADSNAVNLPSVMHWGNDNVETTERTREDSKEANTREDSKEANTRKESKEADTRKESKEADEPPKIVATKSDSIPEGSKSPAHKNTAESDHSGEQELELDYGDAEEAEPDKDEVLEDAPKTEKPSMDTKEPKKIERSIRQTSPCRYPEDSVIIIRGLMRPFTLPQLKGEIELKGGKILDFWIDDKRSYCIVELSSVEQAREVRERMQGARWPVSSQRTLNVHFDNKLNLEKHKEGLVGTEKTAAPATTSRTVSSEHDRPKLGAMAGRNLSLRVTLESAVRDNHKHDQEKNERLVEGRREKERELEKRRVESVRDREEPDRKRRRSVTPPRERKHDRFDERRHSERDDAEKQEVKTKTADEIFMKTKALPQIYYLPVTEEEAKVRAAKREADAKREAERSSRRR